ncbi:triose-phosphate isomerase [Terrihabitans sp. B22-R8]|uniref:triose-phosphate isomerase n=1 Tax=Terrihabitans sp. B22-R8 TaxID=3425128 RepID=UPI00403C023E
MADNLRPLIAGNWKMNGLRASLADLTAFRDRLGSLHSDDIDVVVCPPATLVGAAVEIAGEQFAVGGQDCHGKSCGAHTGDVAAEMLADLGARYVIVGHSERRADHHETDADVREKVQAAWRAGLTSILCVGETLDERDAGQETVVVARQLSGSIPDGATSENLVVAYEPVWAIGTGRTPSCDDVERVHTFMREQLVSRFAGEGAAVRLLYGGSVKPSNANELLCVTDVNGALVGGASLDPEDFAAIVRSADASTLEN